MMAYTQDPNDVSDAPERPFDGESEPRPWTAPAFLERSTCAEIGAYAFHEQ